MAGIVLRGAGFAFRKELTRLSLQRAAGATFAFSSLVTPFFMGTVIGAIATGSVPAGATQASLAAWTSPTALLAGFLFVAACGYLAAVYLIGEAARRGDRAHAGLLHPPRPGRRRRGRGAVAGRPGRTAQLQSDAVRPAHRPGAAAGGAGRGVRPGRLSPCSPSAGRAASGCIAALGVAAVVWGWGVAQYPVLLPGTTVTLSNAGAPQSTMVAIVVLFIVAVVLIGPSFALLFACRAAACCTRASPGR